MRTQRPSCRAQPAKVIMPSATARTGVPRGAAKSTPRCGRKRRRRGWRRRDETRRRSGEDHVLGQTVLDTPGGALHLGEVREPGARGVDPLRRALEDEERAVVDLVAQRVERARRAIEAQGEPAPRMEAMEV